MASVFAEGQRIRVRQIADDSNHHLLSQYNSKKLARIGGVLAVLGTYEVKPAALREEVVLHGALADRAIHD